MTIKNPRAGSAPLAPWYKTTKGMIGIGVGLLALAVIVYLAWVPVGNMLGGQKPNEHAGQVNLPGYGWVDQAAADKINASGKTVEGTKVNEHAGQVNLPGYGWVDQAAADKINASKPAETMGKGVDFAAVKKLSVIIVDANTLADWRDKLNLKDQINLGGDQLNVQGNSQDTKGAMDWDSYLAFAEDTKALYAGDSNDETFGSFMVNQVLPTFTANNPALIVYKNDQDGNDHYALLVKTATLKYKVVEITLGTRSLPTEKESLKELSGTSSSSSQQTNSQSNIVTGPGGV